MDEDFENQDRKILRQESERIEMDEVWSHRTDFATRLCALSMSSCLVQSGCMSAMKRSRLRHVRPQCATQSADAHFLPFMGPMRRRSGSMERRKSYYLRKTSQGAQPRGPTDINIWSVFKAQIEDHADLPLQWQPAKIRGKLAYVHEGCHWPIVAAKRRSSSEWALTR